MKKRFTAALSVMLAAGLMAGCGGKDSAPKETASGGNDNTSAETTSVGDSETAKTDSGATALKLTRSLYFGDVSDSPELKEEWMKVMEEKYGFPIEVTSLPRNDYNQKVNLNITSGEAEGMIGMFGIGDVMLLKEQGAIEPLDDYLKDNEVWNSLPKDMQDMFKIDGEIWAIPGGYQESMFTRTIRKDWLDNLKLEVPTNLDEFYEVSKQFTFNDPDGNGKDDTYGVTASGVWNLQDIFMAFDARLDKQGEGSITYDENAKAYVDSMLKPEMVDALTYLNKMYKEGILDPELFTNAGSNMREKFWASEYGSTFYWIGFSEESRPYLEKINKDVAFAEIPYLEGKLDKNINHVWFNTVPYILVKDSENGGQMVNQFVNVFLGEKDGNLAGVYGIEGTTYKMEGNTLYTMTDPATDTPFKTPGIVTSLPQFTKDLVVAVDGKTKEEIAEMGALSEFKHNTIQESLDSGKAYTFPESKSIPLSPTYTLVEGDIKAAFDTCVSSAITGAVPAADAIEKYRQDVKQLGGQDILDESNEIFGLTGTTTY